MKRHWLIRYLGKCEYVIVRDSWEKQVDQVCSYCSSKGYELKKVTIIESASKSLYTNILNLL